MISLLRPPTHKNTQNNNGNKGSNKHVISSTITRRYTDDAIDEAFKTLGILQSMKGDIKNMRGYFYDDVDKIAEKIIKKFKKDIANRTGQLLHNLDEDKPEKETLKKLIHEFPSSLEYNNHKKQLPILSAVRNLDSVGYVPLLAEQGIKYNVGGNDKRGGLLVGDPTAPYNMNMLQQLVHLINTNNPIPTDTRRLNTMKDLRDMNLLVKNDIKDHDLLHWACGSKKKLRFEYLADWSQDGLKTHKHRGLPIFHSIIKHHGITNGAFPTFLEVSLQRHPRDAGLLFQKDQHGKTACEYAFDRHGREETLNILRDLIPPDAPQFPILHHVAKHIPQHMDDFALRYPLSMHARDTFGRTLSQAENHEMLASGTKTYRNNITFFVRRLSDEDLRIVDPDRAGLYPFMIAASGNTSDLSAVNYLLRRDPSLAYGGKKVDHSKSHKRKRRREETVIKIE